MWTSHNQATVFAESFRKHPVALITTSLAGTQETIIASLHQEIYVLSTLYSVTVNLKKWSPPIPADSETVDLPLQTT